MPITDGSESNEELEGRKYAVHNNKIAYASEGERFHSQVARKNFSDILEDDEGRPIVEDAGEIMIVDGKIMFAGVASKTCKVKGEGRGYQGRSNTREIGLGIFGTERIY